MIAGALLPGAIYIALANFKMVGDICSGLCKDKRLVNIFLQLGMQQRGVRLSADLRVGDGFQ